MKIWAVKYTLTAQVKSMCGKHRLCLVDSRQKSSVLTFHHRVVISLSSYSIFFSLFYHMLSVFIHWLVQIYTFSLIETLVPGWALLNQHFSRQTVGETFWLWLVVQLPSGLCTVFALVWFSTWIFWKDATLLTAAFKFSISTLKSNLSNTTGRLVVRVRHRAVRSALSTPPRFPPRD